MAHAQLLLRTSPRAWSTLGKLRRKRMKNRRRKRGWRGKTASGLTRSASLGCTLALFHSRHPGSRSDRSVTHAASQHMDATAPESQDAQLGARGDCSPRARASRPPGRALHPRSPERVRTEETARRQPPGAVPKDTSCMRRPPHPPDLRPGCLPEGSASSARPHRWSPWRRPGSRRQ